MFSIFVLDTSLQYELKKNVLIYCLLHAEHQLMYGDQKEKGHSCLTWIA